MVSDKQEDFMKRVFQMLVLGILTLGCIALFPVTMDNYPHMGVGLNCNSAVITKEEIQFALEYQKKIFPETEWERNYSVQEDHVFVARTSNPLNAAVSIDLIRLCDSATELDNYASAENIEIIMENYDAYEITDSCEQDGVLLFHFQTTAHEEKYNGRLWFQSVSQHPHRAIEVFLVFPELDSENMETYSSAFFPDFPSCK
jgi:hypothetical protein